MTCQNQRKFESAFYHSSYSTDNSTVSLASIHLFRLFFLDKHGPISPENVKKEKLKRVNETIVFLVSFYCTKNVGLMISMYMIVSWKGNSEEKLETQWWLGRKKKGDKRKIDWVAFDEQERKRGTNTTRYTPVLHTIYTSISPQKALWTMIMKVMFSRIGLFVRKINEAI